MDNDLQKEINGPLHSQAQFSNVWFKFTVNYRHLGVCSHIASRLHTGRHTAVSRSGNRGTFTVLFTVFYLFVTFSPLSLSCKGKLKRFSHLSFKTRCSIRTSTNFVTPFLLTTCSVCHFYSNTIFVRE